MSDVGGFKLWLILMAFCIVALISIGMLMTSAASVFYWSELFGPTGGVLRDYHLHARWYTPEPCLTKTYFERGH